MLHVDQIPTKVVPKQNYKVLGIDISPYSQDEFYTIIESQLSNQHPDSPLFVVTVNPEIVILSILDNEYRDIITHSSINTADGVGISWAINYLYKQRVDRITGSDSLERICRVSAKHQQSVFFYGAMPSIAEQAAEKLRARIPELEVAGTYSPSRPDLSVNELPLDVQYYLKNAEVIFVALGAPAQEKWIHQNISELPNCKLIIGIGGSFDFIAGNINRAPAWMCKLGMEWVYRLYTQPKRWRRMVKLPMFAFNILLLKMSDQYKQLNPS
jgi:N-acetylglucosaminyldiphosphoundecaprenol N-acetyl-beta-D-mannosaminyltransferase